MMICGPGNELPPKEDTKNLKANKLLPNGLADAACVRALAAPVLDRVLHDTRLLQKGER